MKVLKRLGITVLVLICVSRLAIACYDLGGYVFNLIPLWLSKSIIGVAAFTIGCIIVVIFALGIIKIREFEKD